MGAFLASAIGAMIRNNAPGQGLAATVTARLKN
jgi:hypothetical protein